MDIIQFIGFLVSLVAIIVLTGKHLHDERRRKQNPEEYAKEQTAKEERLHSFLKSLEGDMQERKSPTPLPKPKKVTPRPAAQKKVEPVKKEAVIASEFIVNSPLTHHPEGAMKRQKGRGRSIFNDLPNKKLLILIPEIMAKPKWRE